MYTIKHASRYERKLDSDGHPTGNIEWPEKFENVDEALSLAKDLAESGLSMVRVEGPGYMSAFSYHYHADQAYRSSLIH